MQENKPADELPVDPTEWLSQFIEVAAHGNLFGQIIAEGDAKPEAKPQP